MMFMVLVEGNNSRGPKLDEDGFTRTNANVGFFPTLEAVDNAIEKIKSHADDDKEIIVTVGKVLE